MHGPVASFVVATICSVAWSVVGPSRQEPSGSAHPRTRVEVRRFRGDIAMTDKAGTRSEWGTWAYLGWDAEKRAAFRKRYRAEGYTHVAFNLALDYGTFYPRFDYRSDIARVRTGLQELRDDGLVPVLCATQAETYGRHANFKLQQALKDLDAILPQIADLLPAAWAGWESSDFMTAEQHWAVLRKLRQHLPNAYIGVQPGRMPEDGLIAVTSKGVDTRRFWHELRGIVDALFFEPPTETFEDEAWRERLFDDLMGASARVHGRLTTIPDTFPFAPDRSTRAYRENWTRAAPVANVDVIYFEGPAYLRWSSDRKREAGAISMAVPGVIGCMDGCPRPPERRERP
ncbi:MAG TPA: hypothetical protein VM791_14210 [Vicinamibacterales bacterium]|nr:hypothetical protein [Vicinamibacterales bacterium]